MTPLARPLFGRDVASATDAPRAADGSAHAAPSDAPADPASREIAAGSRFAFGRNWQRFLATLDEERIEIARLSLIERLSRTSLEGTRFLDAGSGSGLFSLAARRLGAVVHSFDYDMDSVECTRAVRRTYRPDDPLWAVEWGDVLDREYLARLGQFDVVYSWGVLHHTGAMWRALASVMELVGPGGQLFISIYNDVGGATKPWRAIKRTYNRGGRATRLTLLAGVGTYFAVRGVVKSALNGRMARPGVVTASKKQSRGMSVWHDLVDWVGGYPYEVARPEEVFDFCKARGFVLERLTTARGTGCNEFVFRRPIVDVGAA
jgi:2-polyprenyl-6-hydroxyphenyl methylase/3-demethylubiquinone-9 3-methyltransferase